MEATVTIALSEVESLKKQVKDLKEESNRYKNQKEFNITFDCQIYDNISGKRIQKYSVMTYGNFELLKENNNWKEIQSLTKEAFEQLLSESNILKFYNKFPNWAHKLLKCY